MIVWWRNGTCGFILSELLQARDDVIPWITGWGSVRALQAEFQDSFRIDSAALETSLGGFRRDIGMFNQNNAHRQIQWDYKRFSRLTRWTWSCRGSHGRENALGEGPSLEEWKGGRRVFFASCTWNPSIDWLPHASKATKDSLFNRMFSLISWTCFYLFR